MPLLLSGTDIIFLVNYIISMWLKHSFNTAGKTSIQNSRGTIPQTDSRGDAPPPPGSLPMRGCVNIWPTFVNSRGTPYSRDYYLFYKFLWAKWRQNVRWPDSANLKSKFKNDESKSLISIRRFHFRFAVLNLDSQF